MPDLRGVFDKFADKVGELDGRSFVKLCKDAKLVDKNFTTTDVDLIFARVKPKGGRKINFSTFENFALPEVAKKKKVEVTEIVDKITACEGPSLNNVTRTDSVRFHDDKSTYTGVHAHGGPTTVDRGRNMVSDISEIADRSSCDVRGVKLGLTGKK